MPRHCGMFDVDRWLSINFTVDDSFFFSPLNDRDAQEETPIWIRQHSGPVTRNGPSFISWAWVCSRPIINYLISTLFNQRSGGMSGQRASRDFTAIDFIRSRRADEVLGIGRTMISEIFGWERRWKRKDRNEGEDRSGASPESSAEPGISG